MQDLEVCAHCEVFVSKGIACDNCSQWYHYVCECLDDQFIDFYEEGDVPYSCLSCRQLTLHQDQGGSLALPESQPVGNPITIIIQEENLRAIEIQEESVNDDVTKSSDKPTSLPSPEKQVARVSEVHRPPGTTHSTPPTSVIGRATEVHRPPGTTQTAATTSENGREVEVHRPPRTILTAAPTSMIGKVTDVQRPSGTTQTTAPTSVNGRVSEVYRPPGTTQTAAPISVNGSAPQPKQPKRKKQENPTRSDRHDLQQQMDFSTLQILKLEKKIEDLERSNSLLRRQHPYTEPTPKPSFPTTPHTHGDPTVYEESTYPHLLLRLQSLESEVIKARLTHMENIQQLSLQVNQLSMNAGITQPTYQPAFPQQMMWPQPVPSPVPMPSHPLYMPISQPMHYGTPSTTPNETHAGARAVYPPRVYPSRTPTPTGAQPGASVSHPSSSYPTRFPAPNDPPSANRAPYPPPVPPTRVPVIQANQSVGQQYMPTHDHNHRQTRSRRQYHTKKSHPVPRFNRVTTGNNLLRSSKRSNNDPKSWEPHSTPKKVRFEDIMDISDISELSQQTTIPSHENKATKGKDHVNSPVQENLLLLEQTVVDAIEIPAHSDDSNQSSEKERSYEKEQSTTPFNLNHANREDSTPSEDQMRNSNDQQSFLEQGRATERLDIAEINN